MDEMQINQQIGKRLRLLRNLQGISQESMGDALGVSAQQIQKYEKGTNSIKASKLYELACYLNIPIGNIFRILHEQSKEEGDKASVLDASADAVKLLHYYRQLDNAELQAAVVTLVRSIAEHHVPVAEAPALKNKA